MLEDFRGVFLPQLTDPSGEIRVATFIRCRVDNSRVLLSSHRLAIISTVELNVSHRFQEERI